MFPGKISIFFLRKLILPIFLFLAVAVFSVGGSLAGADPFNQGYSIYLHGKLLKFDVPPFFKDNFLLIPVRKTFEEMGFYVSWEQEARRVVISGRGREIVLYPGNPLYSLNGSVSRSSYPPFIEKGRTMVPLDFLEATVPLVRATWDERAGTLYLELREDGVTIFPPPSWERPVEERPHFIEVLLPPGNRVTAGENLEIQIKAPLTDGIFAYEVRFFFNPDIIRIKDISSPFYCPGEDFFRKSINNREGFAEYTQAALGYREVIPPRGELAVFEAKVLREGAVPFIDGTLKVTLLDNRARVIPAALEEKTLYITSFPAEGGR